ncbi:MAG: MGMT family protein [Planctomycetes bacterium]|jgi:O-6-methylguanine DNA methyltransferase|nr:MGMT family protein [Planctomycetota bacterium]
MKGQAAGENLTPFQLRILTWTKKIPRGRVTTYAELARAIGYPRAYRAVGNGLHQNPWAPRVPCHRVVRSGGYLGGYGGGPIRKEKLLKKEGISIDGDRIADWKRKFYRFKK